MSRITRFTITRPDVTICMNDGAIYRVSRRTGEFLQVEQRDPFVVRPGSRAPLPAPATEPETQKETSPVYEQTSLF